MRYLISWPIVILFAFVVTGDATAQTVIKALPRWMVSMHVDAMIPKKPIQQFLDNDQWGYRFEAQYRIQYNKPFMAGLYFSEADLSRYVLKYTEMNPDGDIKIKEKAITRRQEYGLTFGFFPEVNWLLQPYVLGRMGMAMFRSSSVLTDQDSGEFIDRIPELTTFVNGYGLDFGFHIVPNIWYIRGDVRIGIVANPSVNFLSLNEEKEGTVQYPIEAFDEHVSSGRWLKVSVGVSYLF
jgi:hypothetical protein